MPTTLLSTDTLATTTIQRPNRKRIMNVSYRRCLGRICCRPAMCINFSRWIRFAACFLLISSFVKNHGKTLSWCRIINIPLTKFWQWPTFVLQNERTNTMYPLWIWWLWIQQPASITIQHCLTLNGNRFCKYLQSDINQTKQNKPIKKFPPTPVNPNTSHIGLQETDLLIQKRPTTTN